MKRLFLIFILIVVSSFNALAQDDYRKKFDSFTEAAQVRHSAFRDTVNIIFAQSISAEWESVNTNDGLLRSNTPDYAVPPVADATYSYSNKPIQVSDIISPTPLTWSSGFSSEQWADTNSKLYKQCDVNLYGVAYSISVPVQFGHFHPDGLSENSVSAFWSKLGSCNYKVIVTQCERLRTINKFNDWLVYQLIIGLAETLFPNNIHSEQEIFSAFMLNQLGLMARLGRLDNRLTCLIASLQTIYSRDYVVLDTYPFYLISDTQATNSSLYTYRTEFPQRLRPFDFRLPQMPIIEELNDNIYTHHSSVMGKDVHFSMSTPLLRMYNSYPQLDVNVYASASLEFNFKQTIINEINPALENMTEVDAINHLLKYLHIDFKYKTDIEQFGYEKPFFCEENYKYSYNDCEDRVILLAQMIRVTLGLDTLILDFDNHVALGVCTKTKIKGDYLTYNGKTYYVCDPTYIGSTIGMMIPKYKSKPAKVYPL